jgi:hypothetical protein
VQCNQFFDGVAVWSETLAGAAEGTVLVAVFGAVVAVGEAGGEREGSEVEEKGEEEGDGLHLVVVVRAFVFSR